MLKKTRQGILLSNTGTPAEPTGKEIKKFMGRFLMDERIVPMNKVFWWVLLHVHILPLRGRRNEVRYQTIWTEDGSPFTLYHTALEAKLSEAYRCAGCDEVSVACGMSYSHPDIYDALKRLKEAGCEKLEVLPLYPQSTSSTTGAVSDGVQRALKKLNWDINYHFIENYHDNPVYIKAIADSIRAAGFKADSNDRVVFSFHSIPMVDIEAGDTYDTQVETTCSLIADEVGIDESRRIIGYQCRFDSGREWLKPYTVDVLSDIAKEEPSRLFFVCPNFAVDCLETLYDIEYEIKPHYAQALEAEGRKFAEGDFVYVPCLNSSDAHVGALMDVLSSQVVSTS